MAKLSEEKIPFKVFRIVCLVLIFVVIAVTLGVYFITKKSFTNSYDRYSEIVANDIKVYGEDSVFDKEKNINVTYQKSILLSAAAQDPTKPQYNLLNTQYLNLLKFSNTYFETYIKDLVKNSKSLNRSKMNNLYKKIDNLESVILKFEQDKAELENLTITGQGVFDYNGDNCLIALNTHMKSYVSLTSAYLNLNNTLADIHIELEDFTLELNNKNAKTMVNFAIMYATNYMVINYFETTSDNNKLFESFVNDEIFTLTKNLYEVNEADNELNPQKRVPIEASQNTANYNYLFNRAKNINVELDNLRLAASKIKNGTTNTEYSNVLTLARQDVLAFLQNTFAIIKNV